MRTYHIKNDEMKTLRWLIANDMANGWTIADIAARLKHRDVTYTRDILGKLQRLGLRPARKTNS